MSWTPQPTKQGKGLLLLPSVQGSSTVPARPGTNILRPETEDAQGFEGIDSKTQRIWGGSGAEPPFLIESVSSCLGWTHGNGSSGESHFWGHLKVSVQDGWDRSGFASSGDPLLQSCPISHIPRHLFPLRTQTVPLSPAFQKPSPICTPSQIATCALSSPQPRFSTVIHVMKLKRHCTE